MTAERHYAEGGLITGPNGPGASVPIVIHRGCSYFPIEMVRQYGLDFLKKLNGGDPDGRTARRPDGATAERFWFADVDPEMEGPYVWQPCLETGAGVVPSFEIWFESKELCEQWIRENVIGVPLETA